MKSCKNCMEFMSWPTHGGASALDAASEEVVHAEDSLVAATTALPQQVRKRITCEAEPRSKVNEFDPAGAAAELEGQQGVDGRYLPEGGETCGGGNVGICFAGLAESLIPRHERRTQNRHRRR